jgi:hypothetical protein
MRPQRCPSMLSLAEMLFICENCLTRRRGKKITSSDVPNDKKVGLMKSGYWTALSSSFKSDRSN